MEASFDVYEEGGDLEPGSLEGAHLMDESEAGVGGGEAWKRGGLLRMKEALGSGDGGQLDRHYPFEDLQYGFQ